MMAVPRDASDWMQEVELEQLAKERGMSKEALSEVNPAGE